jgi:hypothetical protein
VLGRLAQDGLERLAGHRAVDPAVLRRRVALDGEDVLTGMILHDLLADRLDLMPRRRLQRVVVVQRDHVEDDVLRDRMRRADE